MDHTATTGGDQECLGGLIQHQRYGFANADMAYTSSSYVHFPFQDLYSCAFLLDVVFACGSPQSWCFGSCHARSCPLQSAVVETNLYDALVGILTALSYAFNLFPLSSLSLAISAYDQAKRDYTGIWGTGGQESEGGFNQF